MEIFWTSRAEADYSNIIGHLLAKWTRKEALKFIMKTDQTLERIIEYPNIGIKSSRYPDLRKLTIVKQITMFYQVKGNTLYVTALWNTLQDPSKLEF